MTGPDTGGTDAGVAGPGRCLPTAAELVAAGMADDWDDQHPHAAILGAVFLLANRQYWCNGDLAGASTDGSVVFGLLGVDTKGIDRYVRGVVAEGIDRTVPGVEGFGSAVAAIGSALPQGAWSDADPADRGVLVAACRQYDRVVHTCCECSSLRWASALPAASVLRGLGQWARIEAILREAAG